MCGLAGIFDCRPQSRRELPEVVVPRMTRALQHRGPDDEGFWSSRRKLLLGNQTEALRRTEELPAGENEADFCVVFGHRRLAIHDLTVAGRQPMMSADSRWVVVFNGEVYNFRELRSELEAGGRVFQSASDTEVLTETLAAWGPHQACRRWRGMFAVAAWDRREERLYLIRDRAGLKPLYAAVSDSRILFASELRAFRTDGDLQPAIRPAAVRRFMHDGYVSGAESVYQDVLRLPPASLMTVYRNGAEQLRTEVSVYWERPSVSKQPGSPSDFRELDERFSELLREAVGIRLSADVPVGTFLSGGLDSALITSVASSLHTTSLMAVTMGFEESEFDESDAAAATAAACGVRHVIRRVSADAALQCIPRLAEVWDEPFADSSQIPTLLLCETARREGTVYLSGDGGDELFAGYRRYRHLNSIRRKLARVPYPLRLLAAKLLQGRRFRKWLRRDPHSGDDLRRILSARGPGRLYDRLNAHWRSEQCLSSDLRELCAQSAGETDFYEGRPFVFERSRGNSLRCSDQEFIDGACGHDFDRYLPDDILTKVDRASMAVGLEARVPLLDHHLVEFVLSAPSAWRYSVQEAKLPMRRLLKAQLPPKVLSHPKKGFGVPLASWLRGPLRDWGEELLSVDALNHDGCLNARLIRSRWEAHLRRDADWHYLLWDALMWMQWRRSEGHSAVAV